MLTYERALVVAKEFAHLSGRDQAVHEDSRLAPSPERYVAVPKSHTLLRPGWYRRAVVRVDGAVEVVP